MKFKFQTAPNVEAREIKIDQGSLVMLSSTNSSTVAKAIETQFGAAQAGMPTIAQQLGAQMGITPGMTLYDAMSGKHYCGPEGAQAATVGGDGSVTGRLVVQAVLFDAVEKSMRDDLSGYPRMLQENAALVRSIDGTKWERPILNFTRPENTRPQPVAQLSEPQRMLTLTTAMRSNAILGDSIGIEVADQVAKDITIAVVSLSLKRAMDESATNLAMYQIMSMLNGDEDYGMAPLANIVRGGAAKASVLDPAATAGKLTQTAWIKWLWRGNLRRTITTVVTDLAGALAIENREGRPVSKDEKINSNRIDTLDSVANPRWPDKVDVIITQDPSWPAGTIVGFDKKYAYNYITSAAMEYKATESFAIRRSTKMRIDTGSMVERFMDDAWDLLDFN